MGPLTVEDVLRVAEASDPEDELLPMRPMASSRTVPLHSLTPAKALMISRTLMSIVVGYGRLCRAWGADEDTELRQHSVLLPKKFAKAEK
jgi:hypothetical protein